ncbi:LytTR family DNA-binding domain-containing protein [Tenacibaculum sp. SG-28]|uniref:LytR/AlgR family response regulator transcription factor n=1 Tax=Tenacibaculum sp. SG-28 TaxID=754426 RepID=UPI000CF49D2A|nr:LytTR family DNA-binding domain-containing protein [Tenacibaculum sp. SG-28]PQJ23014.1 hypothetical protein BSU00_01720 [Tenacibaculum sp. SG-28]
MNTVEAIIVDDEQNARENLRYLLQTFCPNIIIVNESSNVDQAYEAIQKYKPKLVFLDIEMPRKNGFQLLEMFTDITFQVIFITAYDSYAIKAFEVSAIDYLLKPIDISRLETAVLKASKNLLGDSGNMDALKSNTKEIKKLAIPYKSDYVIIDINDLLCIEADRMYSVLHTKDDNHYLVSKKLSYYEEILCQDKNFIRVHRSWIVNSNLIQNYSKKNKELTLETQLKIPVSRGYKDNFESLLYN